MSLICGDLVIVFLQQIDPPTSYFSKVWQIIKLMIFMFKCCPTWIQPTSTQVFGAATEPEVFTGLLTSNLTQTPGLGPVSNDYGD